MGQIAIKTQQLCCCKENKQIEQCPYQELQQYIKIQSDHTYFFEEAWFTKDENTLFITEKFIFLYNNYEEDNVYMEKTWKQIDMRQNIKHGVLERDDKTEVLAPKWKYLIRKGVPMRLMKTLILDIYKRTFTDNEMEYQIALKIVFKDQIPASFRTTPVFMQDNRPIEEIVKVNILNKQGFDALKRIMWVLTEMYYQIEYNPMVIQITTMLLMFLKEEETYCVLKCMTEDSIKLLNTNNQNDDIQRAMRWHFLLKRNDFVRFLKAFFDTVVQKSATFNQIVNHFKEIGFDYQEFFADVTNSIFYGYLTFSAVLKIFIMYLNEGMKVYFRFMYALCYTLKDDILKTRDRSTMKSLIRSKGLNLNLKQIRAMIQKGYSLRLTKFKKQLDRYSIDSNQKAEARKIYYLPHLEQSSNIIQQEQLEIIWDWLPSLLKLSDPVLIWNTSKDGYSLNSLYKKCEYYIGKQMLILIKADVNNSIFGVYCDEMLSLDSKRTYYGSNETFVFQLYPTLVKYESKSEDNHHCYSCKDYFTFGSNGIAIMVDQQLNKGHTEPCQTYQSENLTGDKLKNEFTCLDLELYTFE